MGAPEIDAMVAAVIEPSIHGSGKLETKNIAPPEVPIIRASRSFGA
tara:strand:+ start:5954 stop:6091 length:138 start_codon:yes stop_codon:yes gene_type:complete